MLDIEYLAITFVIIASVGLLWILLQIYQIGSYMYKTIKNRQRQKITDANKQTL